MNIETDRRNDARPQLGAELRLIPRWSVMLAALAFVGVEYLWWVVVPEHRHHPPPPLGLRVYFALTWGALAALYMLMIEIPIRVKIIRKRRRRI